MPSFLQRYLLTPRAPQTAAGFLDDSFAVVDLRKGRRGFSLASSALTPLRPGLINPAFETSNIPNPAELTEIISQTAEAAGLSRKRRWSVALPEGAARTLVVSLESKPASRRELEEILSWKIERIIATPTAELRISRERISPTAGQERYIITVVRNAVVAEYETIFESIGWQAGLLLPRHLGEAQWLAWDERPGDKMLVSANHSGFTAVVVRGAEPVLVRSYVCEPSSHADELHRFALYYRDRIAGGPQPQSITGMLVIGGIDAGEASQAIQDALDIMPQVLDSAEFGLDLRGEPIRFDQLAGAAGMATFAWQ